MRKLVLVLVVCLSLSATGCIANLVGGLIGLSGLGQTLCTAFDANGDGQVTTDEVKAFYTQLGMTLSDSDAQTVIDTLCGGSA